MRILCVFFLSPLKGGISFCIVVASYMVAEPRGGDSSMSSVSTESQYGLRHINGVPVWDGYILTLQDYETAAPWKQRQKSCHRFGLLMQSDASRKKRNWIYNLNACCACAGSSRGNAQMGGDALGHFGISAPRTYKCTDSSTDTWKYFSSFVTSSMRPAQTSGPCW